MRKEFFLISAFFFSFAVSGFASQIPKISLSELYAKADLIVMGAVSAVTPAENQDTVTIRVDSSLKGENIQEAYTFTLITRGGLKDFDPCLRKGDTGIFFLKWKGPKNQVEKAYWGSIAIFQKNHFFVKGGDLEMDLSRSLDAWRSYREKQSQIRRIEEYERGFQAGFTGPPGLVDGSPDFNLGHSDGMLAKEKKLPEN